jgi:large conductance mechanosensitive channel
MEYSTRAADEAREAAQAAARRAYSLLEEFKNFAFKGNVVDLAVGVIIGAAFGKIVDSLVRNIIMPLLSYVVPGSESYEKWTLGRVEIGQFLAVVLNFLIVAVALYLFIVKFLGLILKSKKTPPPSTRDQELLAEIRDLLKADLARRDAPATGSGANRD